MMQTATAPRTIRYFGRCTIRSCKHRQVRDMTRNDMARAINTIRCPEHHMPTTWLPLEGTLNPEKACMSRCMASTGPSCSCSCGGENHGTAHL